MTHWLLHAHAVHLRDFSPGHWTNICERYKLEGIYYEGKREEPERGRSVYQAGELERFVAAHGCDPAAHRAYTPDTPENHADRLAALVGTTRLPWEDNQDNEDNEDNQDNPQRQRSGVLVFAASHPFGVSEPITCCYGRFEVWVAREEKGR